MLLSIGVYIRSQQKNEWWDLQDLRVIKVSSKTYREASSVLLPLGDAGFFIPMTFYKLLRVPSANQKPEIGIKTRRSDRIRVQKGFREWIKLETNRLKQLWYAALKSAHGDVAEAELLLSLLIPIDWDITTPSNGRRRSNSGLNDEAVLGNKFLGQRSRFLSSRLYTIPISIQRSFFRLLFQILDKFCLFSIIYYNGWIEFSFVS